MNYPYCDAPAPDGVNLCRELVGHQTQHYDGDRVRWPNSSPESLGSLDKKQVGGDHYAKRHITPWHIIDEYGLDFYAGNALKYLLRSKDKGGLEDLKKAAHYIEKMIELREKKEPEKQEKPEPCELGCIYPHGPKQSDCYAVVGCNSCGYRMTLSSDYAEEVRQRGRHTSYGKSCPGQWYLVSRKHDPTMVEIK